ncbi:hypothetical protein EK904_013953 [Melospiza melodia maxima]|nr:hypothetical protein EK904_013953 [Melospiza melodia maxima]
MYKFQAQHLAKCQHRAQMVSDKPQDTFKLHRTSFQRFASPLPGILVQPSRVRPTWISGRSSEISGSCRSSCSCSDSCCKTKSAEESRERGGTRGGEDIWHSLQLGELTYGSCSCGRNCCGSWSDPGCTSPGSGSSSNSWTYSQGHRREHS